MAESFLVSANEQVATLLFAAGTNGASLIIFQTNANDVQFYLGGPNITLSNGFLINISASSGHSYLPLILGPNEELWGLVFRSTGSASFSFLVTGVPSSQPSGPEHVIVDGGEIIADQGSPNSQAWPVLVTKP